VNQKDKLEAVSTFKFYLIYSSLKMQNLSKNRKFKTKTYGSKFQKCYLMKYKFGKNVIRWIIFSVNSWFYKLWFGKSLLHQTFKESSLFRIIQLYFMYFFGNDSRSKRLLVYNLRWALTQPDHILLTHSK